MTFMQITFKYEFVQVLFQDLPALVKDLDGFKRYRSLKEKKNVADIALLTATLCVQDTYLLWF